MASVMQCRGFSSHAGGDQEWLGLTVVSGKCGALGPSLTHLLIPVDATFARGSVEWERHAPRSQMAELYGCRALTAPR